MLCGQHHCRVHSVNSQNHKTVNERGICSLFRWIEQNFPTLGFQTLTAAVLWERSSFVCSLAYKSSRCPRRQLIKIVISHYCGHTLGSVTFVSVRSKQRWAHSQMYAREQTDVSFHAAKTIKTNQVLPQWPARERDGESATLWCLCWYDFFATAADAAYSFVSLVREFDGRGRFPFFHGTYYRGGCKPWLIYFLNYFQCVLVNGRHYPYCRWKYIELNFFRRKSIQISQGTYTWLVQVSIDVSNFQLLFC